MFLGRALRTVLTLLLAPLVRGQIDGECKEFDPNHFCRTLSNHTYMYSFQHHSVRGHNNFDSANEEFKSFGLHERPLGDCNEYVDLFICAIYFPFCQPSNSTPSGGHQLKPCRELCEEVEGTCRSKYDELLALLEGIPNPPVINCSELPAHSDTRHCLIHVLKDNKSTNSTPGPTLEACRTQCGSGLVPQPGASFAGIPNCSQPCSGVFTSSSEETFATVWVVLWAGGALVISAATIVCWLVSLKSYPSLERPIFYISICYVIQSVGLIIQIAAGKGSVCQAQHNGDSQWGVAQGGQVTAVCVITFFLSYFTTLATWVWWLLMTCMWFFLMVTKQTPQVLEVKVVEIFSHLFGWGIPLAFTITAVASQSYEGNSIVRVCEVTLHTSGAQLGLVIVPQILVLLICIVLLLSGHLWKLVKEQYIKKPSGSTDEKAVVSVIKVDIFSVVCLIQVAILLSINVYQYHSTMSWEENYIQCKKCAQPCDDNYPKPQLGVYMFEVTVQLIIGCLVFLWLRPKSVLSGWKKLGKQLHSLSSSSAELVTTPSTPTTPTWSQTSV